MKTLSARDAGAVPVAALGDGRGPPRRSRGRRATSASWRSGAAPVCPVLLRGLKAALFLAGPGGRAACAIATRLTAIVTAADDGGSSGRLREAYRVLPPGDMRNCLLALERCGSDALGDLRVPLRRRRGARRRRPQPRQPDPGRAEPAGERLHVGARPRHPAARGARDACCRRRSTTSASSPSSRTRASVEGESLIAAVRRPIRRVYLRPGWSARAPRGPACDRGGGPRAPGPRQPLYQHHPGAARGRSRAMPSRARRARVVLVDEPDERAGRDRRLRSRRLRPGDRPPCARRRDRRRARERHAGPRRLDAAGTRRRARGRFAADREALASLGCRPVERDLLGADPLIRHDAGKLARAVVDLALEGAASMSA